MATLYPVSSVPSPGCYGLANLASTSSIPSARLLLRSAQNVFPPPSVVQRQVCAVGKFDFNLAPMFPMFNQTHPCLKSILVDHSNDLKLEPESVGFLLGLYMNVVGEVEEFGCWNVTN